MNRITVVFLFLVSWLGACTFEENYQGFLASSEPLVLANDQLTDAMVHDIFSPPVASRIYAYAALAPFEVAAFADSANIQSLMGQLNGFEKKDFSPQSDAYYPMAAMAAFYYVGARLVFSENKIITHRDELFEKVRKLGMTKKTLEASIEFGEAVGQHVLDYASKDNYHQSRSFEKYTPINDPKSWKPTPPAYMEGIEPNWNKIRPFVLDSANQFIPQAPTPFEITPESIFFQEAKAVMDAGNNLDEEARDIAFFWDCNPYKMNVKGHVMYAEKKITPGGHWIGIAGISSKTANLDWKATSEALILTAIAVFDGFISCWDEKYRSILIRPETYINLYMDEDWVPLLQTPPFPEHTSGHSVISTAASRVLTDLLGEPFHFVDSTEVKFGLGIREFHSFNEAAAEAAISRFYGGIHYIPAIDYGIEQGEEVARHLLSRIKTRKTPSPLAFD
ncbi:vanadium-dependent haloperoxidase [Lunatibacter salilacus]|uniref:vanadium-dependent haloperoxidase n=1 Tax=Lunatibacter salilacus TaxID=2483804 RepID=UPI00131AA3AA|nr:vanadium-dependent haloperoxidase [Lunatibacter salilacus]